MAIRQLLGTIDLLCAILLVALFFGYTIPTIQAAAAFALIGKGVFFINDIASIFDITIGTLMFLFFWTSMPIVALVCACYLITKGLSSLV